MEKLSVDLWQSKDTRSTSYFSSSTKRDYSTLLCSHLNCTFFLENTFLHNGDISGVELKQKNFSEVANDVDDDDRTTKAK